MYFIINAESGTIEREDTCQRVNNVLKDLFESTSIQGIEEHITVVKGEEIEIKYEAKIEE